MTNKRFVCIDRMLPEEIKQLAINYEFAHTPFGEMLLASTAKGLCYLAFVTNTPEAVLDELKQIFPKALYTKQPDEYQQRALAVVLGQGKENRVPIVLHLKGTDFQFEVWQELLEVPFGGLTTYGAIAAKLNRPKACRAVGTAVGDNPVSVLIPCHRVLRSSGALGGYHWGLERKMALLEWEKNSQELNRY